RHQTGHGNIRSRKTARSAGRVSSWRRPSRLRRAHDRGVEGNEARRRDPHALHRARLHCQHAHRNARATRGLEYRQPLHLWCLNALNCLSIASTRAEKETVLMLKDRYDLSLSITSAAARDAYVQASDLALTFYPGAAEAYDRAIDADPNFALAHAGKA